MCTVSWLNSGGGYELFSNRDEKLARAPALGPRIQERDGVRFVAPTDGDFQGTWVGANEFGVSISLLNGAAAARGRLSRGLLVLDLLSSDSLSEVSERVWKRDLSAFAPFTLAVLEPGRHTTVIDWDGEGLAVIPYGEPYAPLVSSSYDLPGAQRVRRLEYERIVEAAGGLDTRALASFHESHAGEPSAYSPCMHRPDAETVSFSRVSVTESQVEFYYMPSAPCRHAPGQLVTLRLRQ